ncbi:MAG: hypothetical protein MUQ25_03785 [Candidatus Aminicenantes bacterium]|nr:hypothetical protein [Candidatus Aminicenantes bacterium]
MAEETAKFGSLSWFKGWGERLANAGLEAVTNVITAKKVSSGSPTVTPGSVAAKALTWLPYALIGAAALVLVLVMKKRP